LKFRADFVSKHKKTAAVAAALEKKLQSASTTLTDRCVAEISV